VRAAVIENCERNGELSIPELRDAIGTTRKFLIPILEAFDTEGLTQRRGNARVLKGR
jgi:selenocysteine-specific elongation factor